MRMIYIKSSFGVSSYPALPMQMNALTRLNGTNYEDWVESLKLFLAVSNVDLALTEDEPPKPTDVSPAADKSKYEKWAHSNKVCLMTMKYTMDKTIKDSIRDIENAKEFLQAVGEKFKKFDKAEKAHYLSLLGKTKYDGVGGVREHVMKLVNWYNKLKSMKVELGESFLIWQVFESLPSQFDVLRTSYNAQQNEWSIDELISILTQEEETMKKGKSHSVQFTSHKGKDKKKFHKNKGRKFQFKKKGSGDSGQHSGQQSEQHSGENSAKPRFRFNGKCKFCDMIGHKQADCWKFKNWLEKKQGKPLALGCCESNLVDVPSHT